MQAMIIEILLEYHSIYYIRELLILYWNCLKGSNPYAACSKYILPCANNAHCNVWNILSILYQQGNIAIVSVTFQNPNPYGICCGHTSCINDVMQWYRPETLIDYKWWRKLVYPVKPPPNHKSLATFSQALLRDSNHSVTICLRPLSLQGRPFVNEKSCKMPV